MPLWEERTGDFTNKLRTNASLTVYDTGAVQCSPGFHVTPGKRDHYILHLVRRGHGIFRMEDRLYRLSAGDMFLIVPDVDVYYEADTTDPWKYYWVAFHGTEARRMLKHTPLSAENPTIHLEDNDILCSCLFDIYHAAGNTPDADADMTGNLYLFFGELMRRTATDPAEEMQFHLTKAVTYIQQHFNRSLPVWEIAEKVGLSRSQLYRIFVDKLGISPVDYLKQYRINEACVMMRNSMHNSIGEIASAVGYSDQLYFSRVFREIKNMTPSEFRRDCQKNKQ